MGFAGNICEGLYQEDCFFGDPTVSFTGLQVTVCLELLPRPAWVLNDANEFPCSCQPSASRFMLGAVQRWRSNLQLLVPFLEQPRIELLSLASDSPTRTVQVWLRVVSPLLACCPSSQMGMLCSAQMHCCDSKQYCHRNTSSLVLHQPCTGIPKHAFRE